MRYTKQDFSVELRGTIYGSIWWSGNAWKDVESRAHDDDTLRDLILRVTNDGDFQNTDLTQDSCLIVTLLKPNKRITRYFDITLFDSISDCIGEKDSCELDLS